MIFTDEQWNEIKKASPHFESARREYIRNAPRWLTETVVNTYEAATGKKIPNRDFTCAICVLRIYQTIGKAYFADLKEREELQKNTEEENGEKEEYGENGENGETEGIQGETEGPQGQPEGTPEEGNTGYVPERNVKKKNRRRNK